ncbi:hypothetical protein AM493_14680 [Flavobacterium akiainvivens]|uniref:Uncharacterized protein n=2 Tax=Flavobacterium akiainvivens TaxID=1202724 RepID=A0A0M9VIY0_9FLAO|nr:hypothetical protein AM493_14680 [Flavobacterium akiainvivens]
MILKMFVLDSEALELNTRVFAFVSDGQGADLFNGLVYFTWIQDSITDEIGVSLLIISGIIFGFSREKFEDEMVASIRLKSLVSATIASYTLLLLGYLFIYGSIFYNVMIIAMVMQLVIFIILLRINMYRFTKFAPNEE